MAGSRLASSTESSGPSYAVLNSYADAEDAAEVDKDNAIDDEEEDDDDAFRRSDDDDVCVWTAASAAPIGDCAMALTMRAVSNR